MARLASIARFEEFHVGRTPDAGVFANVNNEGRTVNDLLTLLYSMPGRPSGRKDMDGLMMPTAEDITTLVRNAEKNVAELTNKNPETKAILEAHFNGSEEAKRGALCVMLYTMDTQHIPVYRWMNAWLDCTERRQADVAKHIGPFFVAYNKAVQLLPLVECKASRSLHDITRSVKLEHAFENPDSVFGPDSVVNLWSVASFTQCDDVANSEVFCGQPDAAAIVFTCNMMRGRQVSLLSAMPGEKEVQPTTPSHFRVSGTFRRGKKLIVALQQVHPENAIRYEAIDLAMTLRQKCVTAIELGSTDPDMFHRLGCALAEGECVRLSHGKVMTQRDVFVNAVELGSTDPDTFHCLANVLGDARVRLTDGTVLNARYLFWKAIELGSTDPETFHQFALLLNNRERVRLADDSVMTQQILLQKSIELGSTDPKTYQYLSMMLPEGENATVDGQLLSESDLLEKAIELGSTDPDVFHHLACVTLKGGNELSCRALFQKAIELGGANSDAFHYLACLLPEGESVTLKGGKVLSQRALFQKAIELGGAHPKTFHNLACLLPKGESVTLKGGKELSRRALLQKAIELGGTNPDTFHNLACLLPEGESVTLKGGKELSRRALLQEAIELGGANPKTFHNLACLLPKGESVTLKGGKELSRRALLQKAIELGGANPDTFHNLACLLPKGESVTLKGGKELSRRALLQEAIELGGANPDTFRSLASLLEGNERVALLGRQMSRLDLLSRANTLAGDDSKDQILRSTDTFVLPDGTTATGLRGLALSLRAQAGLR